MNPKRKLKKEYKLLGQVKARAQEMESLTDAQLQALTPRFKERLAQGEQLDGLLPEAFAAICEADKRILGKYPYDVQILGAIALHEGCLAEMNTGEGKTLVATMPLYLNALTEKSTLLLTSNEYLVIRDAEEMGQVYRFMGLTIGVGVSESPQEHRSNDEKREVYNCDIVYTTHGALGFDYLINNLVTVAEDRFMREFYYVIIDEADSVLLDGAQTPLVISGSPRVQSNLYALADFFVTTLQEDVDYALEDNKVWLTEAGIRYAEEFFQIDNFYAKKHFEINRHVILALRAHKLFLKETDYMVTSKGELALLDHGSGRAMSGVKLGGGLHQAIEEKEKLEVSQETRSMASITFQNFFHLFPKMGGMSGTIADAAVELEEVYGTPVVVIPPNHPLQRKDLPDSYFIGNEPQIHAALQEVLRTHATGQPVLLVVSNIQETEVMSRLLLSEKIPHSVLNANNAFWEAEIIKEAGQKNAVTVATSMAGRGTDIKLGEGVRELGGLAVIGIGRMSDIRHERQARGRAGRQGDPGFSHFFVSLEDDVVTDNGPDNLEKYTEEGAHISGSHLRRIINGAQRMGQENATMSRKNSFDYDGVLQRQRDMIYEMRNDLLDGDVLERDRFKKIAAENIDAFIKENPKADREAMNRYLLDNISYRLGQDHLHELNAHTMRTYLNRRVSEAFLEKEKSVGDQKVMQEFMRKATLRALDDAWVEQVDYLQQLQAAVSGRAMAQRNVLQEYQMDGYSSFLRMAATIKQNIMRNVLLSTVHVKKDKSIDIVLP